MIFTAYFDESGTHAGAELTGMAGFLGDVRQWRKFEKRAGKLFKRFRIDVFHTIDVRRTDKDFAGWSVDRKVEFLDEFQHVINETLESGVAAFLRHEDYRYYYGLNWPKKARRDSKYAILFRACGAQMIDTVGKMPLGHESHLRVVLESGHKNAGDVVRVYNWVQSRQTSPTLASLTFGDKKTCLPLAAADLFAYSARGLETGQKTIGTASSAASYRTAIEPLTKYSVGGGRFSARATVIRPARPTGSSNSAASLSRRRDATSRGAGG